MKISLFLALFFLPILCSAESAYITNQIKAGLHEDKSVSSPILKVLSTGAKIEIIKKEEELTFVRDAAGVSGWINNSYLIAKEPNDAGMQTLQKRATDLEKRLADFKNRNVELENQLKTAGGGAPVATAKDNSALKSKNAELEQQAKAEKLKVAELQIEITELRNRLGQDSDTDSLYEQIKSLEENNKKLEIHLAKTLEKYAAGESDPEAIKRLTSDNFDPGIRNMLIYLLITLFLGLFAGAYLLDFWNRRRHGGFRI